MAWASLCPRELRVQGRQGSCGRGAVWACARGCEDRQEVPEGSVAQKPAEGREGEGQWMDVGWHVCPAGVHTSRYPWGPAGWSTRRARVSGRDAGLTPRESNGLEGQRPAARGLQQPSGTGWGQGTKGGIRAWGLNLSYEEPPLPQGAIRGRPEPQPLSPTYTVHCRLC